MEGFSWKIKGFLAKPSETFREVEKEEIGEGIKYFALLGIIFSVLSGVVTAFLSGASSNLAISIVSIYAACFVAVFVDSLVTHLFVWILGGNAGYKQTLKSYLYSSTPALLLGWIPWINIIAMIWSFILNIVGISELQKISKARAFLAIVLPVIIFASMFIAFVGIAYIWYLSILSGAKVGA